MRNNSFVIQVLFLYILVVAAFLAFIFLFFFRKITADGAADQASYLRRDALLMEDGAKAALSTGAAASLNDYLSARARLLGARITWIAPDGRVLADTEENPSYMDNHAGRPEVKSALSGEDRYDVRFSATLKKEMLYYAHLVTEGGRAVGVLRLSVFMASLERLLTGLKLQYLVIIAFLAVVSAAALLVVHRYFRRAIDRFAGIARRVAEGDFDVRFPSRESREIRSLANSFETMVAKIRALVSDLTAEKGEIEGIISSVDEGIAIVDEEGKVTRANRAFAELFGSGPAAGRYYWEIVRDNDLAGVIREGPREAGRLVTVESGDRALLCSLTRLPGRAETAVVISDVTRVKNWETMKKDLVTNVSHELGTPLTAIKGYVETLRDEEKDERKVKFLDIVARHTERLELIVKDLLVLSRLEDEREPPADGPVRLEDLVERVRPLFAERFRQKGLSLEVRSEPGLPEMRGDDFKLEQALVNLLDNAFKYTDKGGVIVTLSREGGSVKLEVEDTGIGIPEKDMDRIFERFYVVDKSRSRAQGGTGLGLAIVKHIVARHRGELRVKSVLGSGTAFTLLFPSGSS
ncbi:MAG: HAMP domain-containing protein [Spirochaetales bacterium]|nr:HAMP domain-containing protein [Spirochaetales bacterium]